MIRNSREDDYATRDRNSLVIICPSQRFFFVNLWTGKSSVRTFTVLFMLSVFHWKYYTDYRKRKFREILDKLPCYDYAHARCRKKDKSYPILRGKWDLIILRSCVTMTMHFLYSFCGIDTLPVIRKKVTILPLSRKFRWKELFFVRVDFFCREICYDVQIANFPRLLQITVIDQMQNLKSGQRRFSCTCTLPRPKSNWDQNRARSHKAWTWTWLFENKIWAWKNKKSHLAIVGMPRKKYCLRFGVRLITFC